MDPSLLSFLPVSDEHFRLNTRLTNRISTRTAKEPAETTASGIEPRAPAPDLT